MSRCKSCDAEIIWIKMSGGKSMPCDAKPISYRTVPPVPDDEDSPYGNEKILTLITPDGRVARGIFDPMSGQYGYISHFATCPNANQHRRNK